LLNSAKQTAPLGAVVLAECGALTQGGGLNTAFVDFHQTALL